MTDVLDTGTDETTQADNTPADNGEVQYTEVEQIAIDAGWKPASEWKGEGHQTASDFLKHKAKKADESSSEVKRMEKRLDRLGKATEKMLERSLADQREELEAKHAEAVAAGDARRAKNIVRQIDGLEDTGADYAADFKARNAWYEENEEATALAFGVCERNKNQPPERQLEMAEAAVKKAFPELFGEGERIKPKLPALSGPSARASTPRAKTFENLPPEAKAGCASFERHLKNPTPEKLSLFRKDFAANYYEENA